MEYPLFTVLIAAYDQGRYIERTLDTVAAQTFRDFELIVVNDGSTDDTELVVSQWLERFSSSHPHRVVLETTVNQGQAVAFERGLALSRGTWVCLLDSDDLWLPNKLDRVAAAIALAPGAGMVMHPLLVVDGAGRRTGDVRPKRARLSDGDVRDQVRRTSRHVAPATSGVVLRRDVFARLTPAPTRDFKTHADTYLTLGACLLEPVVALEEPLGEYRMHDDGQHVRTMLSVEGLRRYVSLQRILVEHFGLQRAARRNSYFSRNEFALVKLDRQEGRPTVAYLDLVRATVRDDAFELSAKLALTAFWTVCLLAPRALFQRLWRMFQLKQTGLDRVGLVSTTASGI